LKGLRDYMRTADESLTVITNIMAMGGTPAVMLMACYDSPDKDAANKAIGPLLQIGRVVSQDIQEQDYYEFLGDAHPPGGMKIKIRNGFVKELTDEIIAVIVAALEAKPDMILQIRSLGGAVSRFAPDTTAFSFRDSEMLLLSPTFLPPDATPEMERQAM